MKIIFVVAADLDRDGYGDVVIGNETRIACDRAVALVRDHPDRLIAATAGHAPALWDGIWMAQAMKKYILGCMPSARVRIGCARTFDTWGEMESLAEFCGEELVSEVTLVVKYWHAPDSEALCCYWLNRRGLGNVKVAVVRCPSNASLRARAREFFLARPKGLWRRFRTPF